MTDPELLTTRQVADLLQVHPKHVYRLLRRGLPGRRVGGEWRFERREVLDWTAGKAERPVEPEGSRGGTTRDAAGIFPAPPLLAANGDLAVEILLDLAGRRGPPFVGLVPTDRTGGLRLLRSGEVLAAGFHGEHDEGLGVSGPLAEIHLMRREVGLVARSPRGIPALAELGRVRLASRPPTAGVRAHLDGALRSVGVDPGGVHEDALILSSHREVVLAVGRGDADVGVAARSWSRRLRMAFSPLATETYRILVRPRDLESPGVGRLLEAARSPVFRDVVAGLGGYDPSGAGEVRVVTP